HKGRAWDRMGICAIVSPSDAIHPIPMGFRGPSLLYARGRAGERMAIIKLLLIDDHGPLRKALREGLQATGAVQVIGEAATGREAVARALELDIDVILMDVQLQDPQAGRHALSGG